MNFFKRHKHSKDKPPKQSKDDYNKMMNKMNMNEMHTKDVYELSNCGMLELPNSLFYNIDLFLKIGLDISYNKLSSTSSGGDYNYLKDILSLNLSHNLFKVLDSNLLQNLKSLSSLNLTNNGLKQLPESINSLQNLQILNVSSNNLSTLPNTIGDCKYLQKLDVRDNSTFVTLPTTLGKIGKNLKSIYISNAEQFEIPNVNQAKILANNPTNVESTVRHLASLGNHEYNEIESQPVGYKHQTVNKNIIDLTGEESEIEKYLQKMDQDKKIANEMLLKSLQQEEQEMKLITERANKEKEILNKQLIDQMLKDEKETMKSMEQMALERMKIQKEATNIIQKEEQIANQMVLDILKRRDEELPSILKQIREMDEEEMKICKEHSKQMEANNLKIAIESDLQQNAEMANYFQQFLSQRDNDIQNALKIIAEEDKQVKQLVKSQEAEKEKFSSHMLKQIQQDEALQRELLTAALKSKDAEMLNLQADIAAAEKQLRQMTIADAKEREKMTKYIIDNERVELAKIVSMLHAQMAKREKEIAETLAKVEAEEKEDKMAIWLYRYTEVMKQKPPEIDHLEDRLDTIVKDVLMTADVQKYGSLFARHSILKEEDLWMLNSETLKQIGIWNIGEQNRILAAVGKYTNKNVNVMNIVPTAPEIKDFDSDSEKIRKMNADIPELKYNIPIKDNVGPLGPSMTNSTVPKDTAPSAPPAKLFREEECVVCLDLAANIILVPCGHVVVCENCSEKIGKCPMCNVEIESRLRMKN